VFCTQHTGKIFLQTSGIVLILYLEGVPFGGLNPQGVINLRWGNPKHERNFGFQKFISSILSDIEKFMNSTVKLYLKSGKKNGPVIARKLDPRAYPGIRKALKCTITPDIYISFAGFW